MGCQGNSFLDPLKGWVNKIWGAFCRVGCNSYWCSTGDQISTSTSATSTTTNTTCTEHQNTKCNKEDKIRAITAGVLRCESLDKQQKVFEGSVRKAE